MSYEGVILYKKSQTFTDTIYQHLLAIKNYKKDPILRIRYLDIDTITNLNILESFDCLIIHYSIRICFDQIPLDIESFLVKFKKTKVLFIQDEYDNTDHAKSKIRKINFDLVFTCVPNESIERIYPSKEFKSTKFENVLTSYCIDKDLSEFKKLKMARERKLVIGYRGRELPKRYGELGKQKKDIALFFSQYCKKNKIKSDIGYKEEDRIYGKNWFRFLNNCRSSLGSESGCNIFDWDGNLDSKISKLENNQNENIDKFLKKLELKNCMNQISSRVFESINARSALVLIEGRYSNILLPHKHYIPIKKDFSNLKNIFKSLEDYDYLDELTERAFYEISLSRKYSYSLFNNQVNKNIIEIIKRKKIKKSALNISNLLKKEFTEKPLRSLIFQNTFAFKLVKILSNFTFKLIKIVFLILNIFYPFKSIQKKDQLKKVILSVIRKFNIL